MTKADAFVRLGKSKFRSRFKLTAADFAYIDRVGMTTIRQHAEDFVHTKLAPAVPEKDGRQTPMRGHPIFKAMHGSAMCCRGCMEKWWKVPRGRPLSSAQQKKAVDFILAWVERQLVVLALVVVCGCQSVDVNDGGEMSKTLAGYLELCKETAVGEKPSADWKDDWMVDAGGTTWERKADYKIVYADEHYLSFRALEYEFNGGAHGTTCITVGTFDRKTGKLLKAPDLIPSSRRAEVLAALYDGVVKQIGGKENLQGEVKIIDNCFVAKDGIHFVYNEYEVACYAAGAIEVVIK